MKKPPPPPNALSLGLKHQLNEHSIIIVWIINNDNIRMTILYYYLNEYIVIMVIQILCF